MNTRDRVYTALGWLVLLVMLSACGLMCVPNKPPVKATHQGEPK